MFELLWHSARSPCDNTAVLSLHFSSTVDTQIIFVIVFVLDDEFVTVCLCSGETGVYFCRSAITSLFIDRRRPVNHGSSNINHTRGSSMSVVGLPCY